MNLKFRFASFALSVLPVAAGDDVIYSAKSGLGSAKSGLGSAKSGLGSAKGGLSSAKGVINEIQPLSAPDDKWNLGAGISWRRIGNINFNTGNTSLTTPSIFGSSSFTQPAGIGGKTGAIARTYNNGFVNPGPRTPATGRTTDYSYQTQDQLQGNNLLMTATGGRRVIIDQAAASSPSGWKESDNWEISPYLS